MESAAILLLHYFFAFHIMIISNFPKKFAGKAGIDSGGIHRFDTWNAA